MHTAIDERRLLESFLISDTAPPTVDALRPLGLAGWTYLALPTEHPLRAQLRPDFLAMLARHHSLKRALLPLLAAWREADIDVLIFKGFWLSETVYPVPGGRFHRDVDVLLRASTIQAARTIAESLGWCELEVSAGHESSPYAAFSLIRADSSITIDGHQLIVHGRNSWDHAQRRITDAMWHNSRIHEWEGLSVRELDPADAAIALMLHRCWGEQWQLRATDPIDLRMMVQAGRLDRGHVIARALELNCERTVRIFLERCDPWRRRLDLRPISKEDARIFQQAIFMERPFLGLESWQTRARRIPSLSVELMRLLPSFARAQSAMQRGGSVAQVLEALTPALPPERSPLSQRVRTCYAARALESTFGTSRLVGAIALYHALRKQGWPVTLVTGVRRNNGDLIGHAWLELNGEILPESFEPLSPLIYKTSLRYPPPTAEAPSPQQSAG